jgi:hypothetical protein
MYSIAAAGAPNRCSPGGRLPVGSETGELIFSTDRQNVPAVPIRYEAAVVGFKTGKFRKGFAAGLEPSVDQ